jgi:hypothetical protein
MLGVFYRPMEGGPRVFRVIARRTGRERAHNSHHEALLRPRLDDTPSGNHRRGRVNPEYLEQPTGDLPDHAPATGDIGTVGAVT